MVSWDLVSVQLALLCGALNVLKVSIMLRWQFSDELLLHSMVHIGHTSSAIKQLYKTRFREL
jgi:hypothetical protein